MAKKKAARTAKSGPIQVIQNLTFPAVRIYSEWTHEKIKSAERAAENGDLRLAVAVCEWLLSDDRIAGALGSRIDALLGLDPSFEPGAGRARKTNRAVKALEADEDWWEAYRESELRQFLKWGLLLGVCPGRHQWTERPDHGGRVLPILTHWHPQTLKWNWHYGSADQSGHWSVRDVNGVEHELTPGDGEWVLHTPFGAKRPWADGLWRSLARWALLKDLAQRDWARHSETGAQRVVITPEGVTAAERREIADAIRAAGANPVFGLPAGFDIKLVETVANTEHIYNAQIKMADLAISIRIRGGNLSTNVEGGSRAAAEQQVKQNEEPKLKFDAESLSTTLHDQSLTWWAEFNFGDKRLAPWPVWPVEPEEDKAKRATWIKTLGEGLTTWDKLGFDIDPNDVIEDFGLTFLKGRSREREPDPVPGQQGGPGAPGGENDPAPEPAPKQKDQGTARARKSAPRLASRIPVNEASGFVNGQLYADDLTDSVREKAGHALEGSLLGGLLEAIRGAKSYEEVRDAVLKRYRESASPVELRDLTHKALILAELAGAAAVREDV